MRKLHIIFLFCFLFLSNINAQTVADAWRAFQNPSNDCRTKVWWFHGETETTREGITADLEAFKQQGVGGVVYYDQVHGIGENALKAMSQEWWDMLKFSALEAKRLGLTFEAAFSNGYVGGGPWITPEYAMKRLVCTKSISVGKTISMMSSLRNPDADYIIAFPSLKGVDDIEAKVAENIPEGHRAVIDYGKPVTARGIFYTLAGRGKSPAVAMNRPPRADEPFAEGKDYCGYGYEKLYAPGFVECSNDGVNYQFVDSLYPQYSGGTSTYNVCHRALQPTKARYFRITALKSNVGETPLKLSAVGLSSYACADRWEQKNGIRSMYSEEDRTPTYAASSIIEKEAVVDITSFANGKNVFERDLVKYLNKTTGKNSDSWQIMFLKAVPTNGKVKHGRAGMNGLECDKLSREAAELQYNSYFKQIVDSVRGCGGSIVGLAVDSHEAGSQNWTLHFPEHFLRLRGYDITPFLPAMAAGMIVGSKEETDKFYQDVRRTIADLVSTEYFGTIDALCRRDGIVLTAQAMGNGQSMVSDNIMAKGMVQKPQGEFWAYQRDGAFDIKEASSAAHLYNKKIASAEAFTDLDFSKSFGYAKRVCDHALSMGLQEFVVCAAAYQPWTDGKMPGSTGGGRQYSITRTNPLWPTSSAFWDYQARCLAVQRQGDAVVDALVLLGNDAPMKLLANRLPDIPNGTDFDVATDHAFLNGNISRYNYFAVAQGARLSPEAEQKLAGLPRKATLQQDVTGKRLPFTRTHHRRLEDADIYFIHNPSETVWQDTITLRTPYRSAQLWTPYDGKRFALNAVADGQFEISLRPEESAYIVVSDSFQNDSVPLATWSVADERSIPFSTRYWVTGWGNLDKCPEQNLNNAIPLPHDWLTARDGMLKHFSGTFDYHNTFSLTPREGKRYMLRCRKVGDVAVVRVNGKECGTLWASPMEIDITDHVKSGSNWVAICVTNTIINALVGESVKPLDNRYTRAVPNIVKPYTPLVPSGLLDIVEVIER